MSIRKNHSDGFHPDESGIPDDFSVQYEDDFGTPREGEVYQGENGEYDDGYYDGDYGGYADDDDSDGGYEQSYDDSDTYPDGYQDSYQDSYPDDLYGQDYGDGYDASWGDEPMIEETPPAKRKKHRGKKGSWSADFSPPKKEKKRGCLLRIFFRLLALLLVAVIGFTGFLFVRLKPSDFPSDNASLGVNSSVSESGVTNIALFGVDARDYSENTRSDAIMILSVDQRHGKIKLSTLMRDTLVTVPGYGDMKLTESYAYGGPELTVRTINENFDMDIKEYATVTFKAMAAIIDAAGGVEVDITEKERVSANGSVWEQWDACGMDADYIAEAGKQTLSGTQAVAYARIRHVGNADYQRTSRQRAVLTALIHQLITHPQRIPATLMTAEDVVDTSLSQTDLLSLMPILLRGLHVDSARFPLNANIISDSYYVGKSACIYADMDATIAALHGFIYDDVNPTTDSDRRSNGEE